MSLRIRRVQTSLTALLGVFVLSVAGALGLTTGVGGSSAAPQAGAELPPPAILTAADKASFRRLERSLGGHSGVAVSPLGSGQRVQATGKLRSAVAWSTAKVPVAMAVIAAGDANTQRGDLRQAITASDNAAAERLWRSLGDARTAATKATAQLRAAGDLRTVVQSRRLRHGFTAFGQTSWSLADQTRFTAGMPCVTSAKGVLALMAQVIRAHRWGLGAVKADSQFKGGWGPGTRAGIAGGYIDRQMGVLTLRGKSFAVTIATAPRDGSHESGTAHLTRIARWVVAHVDLRSVSGKARCG